MKRYDSILAEYVKYNNDTWRILEEDAKLLQRFSAYVINMANDARFMESSKSMTIIIDIDSNGKLSMVAPGINEPCDATCKEG